MQLSAGGAGRPILGVPGRGAPRLRQPEPAPDRARVRRVGDRQLRILGCDRDLRLPSRRRGRGRHRHRGSAGRSGRGRAVCRVARRSVPSRTRDARLRRRPHRLLRGHRGAGLEWIADDRRLRPRSRGLRLRRRFPSRRGVARPARRSVSAGVDRCERGGEHVRQRRRVRRTGARCVPDRLLGLYGLLHRDRGDVRMERALRRADLLRRARQQKRPRPRRTAARPVACVRCSQASARSPTSRACDS